MKSLFFLIIGISLSVSIYSQKTEIPANFVGMFSLGSRNTISSFSDDHATGIGIGGQFRIQAGRRLNTEWFFDYITSKNGSFTYRNDYHIGWSVMFYPGKVIDFSELLQPYLVAGHCFDYSKVAEQSNSDNNMSRLSMATQAGLGTHLNFSDRFDCSISSQYMVHFGKEIETLIDQNTVVIEKKSFTHPHGHLLFTVSFNYKLFRLWKKNSQG